MDGMCGRIRIDGQVEGTLGGFYLAPSVVDCLYRAVPLLHYYMNHSYFKYIFDACNVHM